jgi:hypothetical protein
LRTRDGKIIAKNVTNHETGVKSAYDRLGMLNTRYDCRGNITYDHRGRAVSKGNTIIAMAFDCVGKTAANSTPLG